MRPDGPGGPGRGFDEAGPDEAAGAGNDDVHAVRVATSGQGSAGQRTVPAGGPHNRNLSLPPGQKTTEAP